jgi:5-hydroxyisourate hydrolase-like protein (transthyretin family)
MQPLIKCVALLAAVALLLGVQAPAGTPVRAADPTCLIFTGTGTISGIVTGSDGAPLDHVAVSAHATDSHTVYYQTTPSAGYTSGIFAFKDIPIGTYVLYFKPTNDDQPEWYNNQPDAASAMPLTLTLGAQVTASMRLRAGAHFNVILRDPNGLPLPSQRVIVYDASGNSVADGTTDSQGVAHTAPGLPVGVYRLRVLQGSQPDLLDNFYNDKPTLESADPLTIGQGQTSVDVQITLQRGAKVSGTLTEATSAAPVAQALVMMNGPNDFYRSATTDASGRYSAVGLPSGLYRISFIPPGAADHLTSLSRLVTLTAPVALDGVDAALSQGGAISGVVTAADGTPLKNAQVYASDVDGDTGYANTDAQGKYTINGLPSGMYALQFVDRQTFIEQFYNRQYDVARMNRVAVTAPNTTAGIDAALPPGGTISGRVTDDRTGAPLSTVTVYVWDPDQEQVVHHVLTGADGTYTTGPVLTSGSYLVRFELPASNTSCSYGQMYYGAAASSATSPRVKVSAPGTVANIDASMEYGSLLYGTVTDAATGRPIEDANVSIYDDGGQFVARASTNLLGRYQTTTALLPGAYRLEFGRGDYMTAYSGGAHTLDAAQPVMVPAQTTGLDAALARGGTLAGHVTAADTDAPLEHARVTLYAADGHTVDSGDTSFDGSYSFERLPSGTYRLGAAPAHTADGIPILRGYGPIFSGGATSLEQAQPVSLAAPQRITIDLAMPKEQDQSPGWYVHLPLIQR